MVRSRLRVVLSFVPGVMPGPAVVPRLLTSGHVVALFVVVLTVPGLSAVVMPVESLQFLRPFGLVEVQGRSEHILSVVKRNLLAMEVERFECIPVLATDIELLAAAAAERISAATLLWFVLGRRWVLVTGLGSCMGSCMRSCLETSEAWGGIHCRRTWRRSVGRVLVGPVASSP